MSATAESKPKIIGLVNLLIIIVLGILLAKLMWLVLTPNKKLNSYTKESVVSNSSQRIKVNYGKLIANQHIFGEVKIVKAPVVAPTTEPVKKVIAPTNLNLKLHGIIAYESKEGFALISSSNGPQGVFAKGDEIEEGKGVFVKEVLPEKVILNNNGTTEELLLPVNQISKQSSEQTSPSYNNRPLNPVRRSNTPAQSIPNRGDLPDLSVLRQDALANPQNLMKIARAYPAITNGQFIGFRVQPGSNRRLFRQLGLRPNDIITEVNGIVLDDASKGFMVAGELSQASELSVTIKRGNREINIQHSF